MRLLTLFAVLALFAGFTSASMAEDDFGQRFSAETPAALDDPESALADIMPAAGDEEQGEGQQETENTDEPEETETTE